MNLKDYFENAKGVGVLATADADGKVNVAVYARPHFLDSEDDKTAAFIMNACLMRICRPIPMLPTSSLRKVKVTLASVYH